MTLDKIELEKRHNNGKRMGGVVVLIVGVVLLLRASGLEMPNWLFSWQMLLIVIGVFNGIKHSFRHHAWWILVAIGLVFMVDEFFYGWSLKQYFWPILVIGVGLAMIFGRRNKKWDGSKWKEEYIRYDETYNDSTDRLDSVAIFGSVRKSVISKDFKGGEMVSVFGGSELNLSQAEFKGQIVLEIVNVMGGTKLIIPSNWELHTSEVVSIFGGIEDKRVQQTSIGNGENILILKGTNLFGGIEIKSF